MSSILGAEEEERLMAAKQKHDALESPFPKRYAFLKSVEPLSRSGDLKMAETEHVCAIGC